jgi:ABC-type cobalamin/Fe3+-siderophores transport system ATPase subunit
MIEIKNLSYRIRGKAILRDVNLRIEPGSFWLIFGPNGAGKTTLFRIIAGLITDYEGEVKIDGHDIHLDSKRQLARKVSYLPQFEEFSLPLTVREILLAGRYPYLSLFQDYAREDYNILHRALETFGIAEFENRGINTLSGGERKKVMLASAYIQDVPIILFDEPFTFLDPEAVSHLKKHMIKLKEQGKTLVVVSHHIEILFPIVNKIAALKNGQVLYAGDKRFDREIFKQTYHIEFAQTVVDNREIIFLNE